MPGDGRVRAAFARLPRWLAWLWRLWAALVLLWLIYAAVRIASVLDQAFRFYGPGDWGPAIRGTLVDVFAGPLASGAALLLLSLPALLRRPAADGRRPRHRPPTE
jgi:hypothetical protein